MTLTQKLFSECCMQNICPVVYGIIAVLFKSYGPYKRQNVFGTCKCRIRLLIKC